jgi:hypothetical protein
MSIANKSTREVNNPSSKRNNDASVLIEEFHSFFRLVLSSDQEKSMSKCRISPTCKELLSYSSVCVNLPSPGNSRFRTPKWCPF